ncbi:MAG: dephospho-CoA kinase [Clostridiales bacterium]|nr:dephospho-CoA kinase [Clostridiales bacterium]
MSLNREIMVIGLTGGIGTGKSTAAAYLKSKGLAHIDADKISRQLTAEGSPMLPVLNRVFGPDGEMGKPGREVLFADGSLDRKALASMVFCDKLKRQKLDEIMFSAIIEEIDRQIKEFQNTGMSGILIDAPLLFEAGLDSRCDVILLLVADEAVKIDRVCKRDGVTTREVRNRINSQMSDEDKMKQADIVIDNSGNEEELYRKLDYSLENTL